MTEVDIPTSEQQRIAAERAEHIRLGLQQAAVLYERALEEEDWRVLGYASVSEWASCEFGRDRFSAATRKRIVQMLTKSGYTQRAIAAATASSPATVSRDQAEAGAPDEAPAPASPRQASARQRESRRAGRDEPPGYLELVAMGKRAKQLRAELESFTGSHLDRTDLPTAQHVTDLLDDLAALRACIEAVAPAMTRWLHDAGPGLHLIRGAS